MHKLTTARGVWLGGLSTGLIAGAAMGAFLMLISGLNGHGFFTPMQLLAGIITGDFQRLDAGSAVGGIIFHLFNSAVIGVVFAAFLRYSTRLVALIFGLGVSIAIWGVATFVALPLVDSALWRSFGSAMVPWFVAHLIFGSILMITPTMVTRMSESSAESDYNHTTIRKAA